MTNPLLVNTIHWDEGRLLFIYYCNETNDNDDDQETVHNASHGGHESDDNKNETNDNEDDNETVNNTQHS